MKLYKTVIALAVVSLFGLTGCAPDNPKPQGFIPIDLGSKISNEQIEKAAITVHKQNGSKGSVPKMTEVDYTNETDRIFWDSAYIIAGNSNVSNVEYRKEKYHIGYTITIKNKIPEEELGRFFFRTLESLNQISSRQGDMCFAFLNKSTGEPNLDIVNAVDKIPKVRRTSELLCVNGEDIEELLPSQNQ